MDKWINKNKISIIIVLVIIMSIVFLNKPQIKTENKTLENSSTATNIDLQTKCANAANLYFNKVKSDQYSQDYQSHWNQQLGKCFIKITSSYPNNPPLSNFGMGVELDDAIEGVYYGSLMTDISGGSATIKVCMYGKSDGDGHGMQRCSTSDQFDSYMASVMNN